MAKQVIRKASKAKMPSSGHDTAGQIQAAVTAEQERNTGHPLLKGMSQAEEMLKKLGGKEDLEAFKIEKQQEWKACINRLASTADGSYFMKMMIEHSGLFASKKGQGAERLKALEGMQAFYLDFVRPLLSAENRAGIE